MPLSCTPVCTGCARPAGFGAEWSVSLPHDYAERVYAGVLGKIIGVYLLEVAENRIVASVDGDQVFELEDAERPLESGAIALVCEEGRSATRVVTVEPVTP